MNFIKENLIDIFLIIGIILISIGSFLTSVVTGFYVTGIMLILFSVIMFFLGGD